MLNDYDIISFKTKLINFINEEAKGLPPSVVGIILENIVNQIGSMIEKNILENKKNNNQLDIPFTGNKEDVKNEEGNN